MTLKQFKEYANQPNVLFRLKDRTTGIEVYKFEFGKRYHWWILFLLAAARLFIKYW